MLRSALPLYARIGFYVATHPWLTAAGYLKVGHSTQVEARLEMASFTTCFTPEWSYYAVVECSTEKEAHVLEQSVLYCLRSRRVPNRELLNVSAHELMPWVHAVAKKLGLRVDVRSSAHEVKALPTTATPPATSFSPTAVVASSSSSSPMNPSPMPVSIVPCTSTKHEMKMDVMEKVQPHTNMNGSPPPLRELAIAPYVSQLDELHREMNHHWYAGEKELSPNSIDVEMDLNEVVEVEDQHDFRLKALRPYQEEAVKRLRAELDLTGQAICQMACRCGKTPVAYHMMEHLLTQASGTNQRVLYLVPGLSLLRQTARKLWSYGLAKRKVPLLLIGSDHLPVYLDPDHNELMTTNRDIIRDVVLRHTALVVICTYHSSPLLSALNLFGLTIFDECHRVCGSAEATAFNTMLLLPRHGTRLFLTATPSYDTPIKMHNTSLFGSVAYRYYLREGIDAGFVNPFSVRVVLGEELHFLPPFLHEAMAEVNKMLVFCRDIQHCEEIYEQLQAATLPDSVEPFTVLMAHSRLGPGAVAEVFGRLVSERRCLVLNVRLFQEGVEVPDLNAVFFASPRYSSRDIIQSICRPLNRVDGKPPSTVFLPAVYEAQHRPDHPINLRHFSTLVPFTDALMDEDPNLFEYMIDPAQRRYNFSVVGVRKLRLSSAKLQRFILPAIRRGVRFSANHTDRFHRAARLPWKAAFAELRRIVVECQRYPKTNDMWIIGESPISMYLFYQYARKGYRLHQAGERSYLESHQICDLESLPEWRRYGVHGPYPWTECLRTLEAHLAKHGAAPPLDIHKGGYVGLNATPFERLAGALMHVNQCDAATGVRLSLEKQADLDEMCGRHNICWRKPRDAQGHLLPGATSFITESYNQFKRLVAEAPKRPVMQAYIQLHFPGYPHKHQRMEELRHLEEGKVPPRRQPRRRRRAKKGENKIAEGEEEEEDTQQVVWCRVCRARIDVVQWNQHTSSPEHLQRQREASLTAASSLA